MFIQWKNAVTILLIALPVLGSKGNGRMEINKIPVLLTEIVNNNSGESILFEYDGTRLTQTTDGSQKSVYVYMGNVITQIKDYRDDALIKTADFSYDVNGRVKRIQVDGINEQYGHYTENHLFTYSGPSSILQTTFELYDNYEDQKPHKMTTEYTLKNGNISLMRERSYEGKAVELEVLKSYTYDKGNNPYSNILGYDKIMPYILESYDEFMTGKCNMTSYRLFQDKKPADLGSAASFSITYYKNNFPEKIISRYYNKDGILYEDITYTYLYNQ